VAQADRPDSPGAMPEPFAQAMADASLMPRRYQRPRL